ncbi:MAG: type II toxin-antitoxin system RelE/ParE family toxin [Anaeromyxobacteraceae bacterium]
MKVQVSPTARRQLLALAAWWNENRRTASVRVEDAFETAVAAMAEHPGLGPAYPLDARYRTWRLRGTPYFLLYRVDDAAGIIWVVAAWSAVTGLGPELP